MAWSTIANLQPHLFTVYLGVLAATRLVFVRRLETVLLGNASPITSWYVWTPCRMWISFVMTLATYSIKLSKPSCLFSPAWKLELPQFLATFSFSFVLIMFNASSVMAHAACFFSILKCFKISGTTLCKKSLACSLLALVTGSFHVKSPKKRQF